MVAYRETRETVISAPRESSPQAEVAPDSGYRPVPKKAAYTKPRWVYHSKRSNEHTPSLTRVLKLRNIINDTRTAVYDGENVDVENSRIRYYDYTKMDEVPLVRQRVRTAVLRKGNIQKLVEPKS